MLGAHNSWIAHIHSVGVGEAGKVNVVYLQVQTSWFGQLPIVWRPWWDPVD